MRVARWLAQRTEVWLNGLDLALQEAQEHLHDPIAALIRAITTRPAELESDPRRIMLASVLAVELPSPRVFEPLPVLVDTPALDLAEPSEQDHAARLQAMLLQLQESMGSKP